MAACPFCQIDEERQQILWTGTYVYIMPSNPMLVPHHLLVIPKRHVEEPWLLEPREYTELLNATVELQRRIVETGYSPWCDVRQHYRPSLPESEEKVNHIHWHILPRRFNDALYQQSQIFESRLFRKLSPTEMAQEKKTLLPLVRFWN